MNCTLNKHFFNVISNDDHILVHWSWNTNMRIVQLRILELFCKGQNFMKFSVFFVGFVVNGVNNLNTTTIEKRFNLPSSKVRSFIFWNYEINQMNWYSEVFIVKNYMMLRQSHHWLPMVKSHNNKLLKTGGRSHP